MTPTAQSQQVTKTAASRFQQLDSQRSEVKRRAEQAAKYTIPALFVRDGHTENTQLPTPYQGLGARAVNNLSSKVLLALFPPNTRFFKLGIKASIKASLGDRVTDVEATLSNIEGSIVDRLEQTKLRATASQAIKSLVVTGNGVLNVDRDLGFRFFGLRSYVVNRDAEGSVLELVIQEKVSPETLTAVVKAACNVTVDASDPNKNVDLYTSMVRDGPIFRVSQEINGITVPNSAQTHPLDAPPFIVLRWTAIHGEEYGRGMVDEYIGDFMSLDDLCRDLLKASAIAAKVIFLRNPGALVTRKQLSTAKSGDVFDGKDGDVTTIGLDKYADFRVVLERISGLQTELAQAFLMNSSVQRNAERVTAEEIRFMAQELEDALGGVYSILAQELQAPLLRRTMKVMRNKSELPNMESSVVNMTITTGLEALGRGHDLNKLVAFVRTAKELLGEEAVAQRMDVQKLLNKIGASYGVDTQDVVLDEETVQANMQRLAMQQMAQTALPGMAQEITKGAVRPNG